MRICIYVCTYICICIYAYCCICVYVHIYIYIRMCMHTYKCTHSTIVRVDFSLAWTLSRIVHPFVTETWHYSLHFPTFPTRQEGLLSPEFNSKPGWNQNYFFPKEKFSFSGWDSAKHLCVPSCFSGPKAIGSAARLFKPLVITGFILPISLCNHAGGLGQ